MEQIVERLKNINIKSLSDDELKVEVSNCGNSFVQHYSECEANKICQDDVLIPCLKVLKSACARGCQYQNMISEIPNLLSTLNSILQLEPATDSLDNKPLESLKLNCIQLAANLCVQNSIVQERVWSELNCFILPHLRISDSIFNNICAMITYNIFISGNLNIKLDETLIINYLLDNVSECCSRELKLNEFVCIFLEHLITDYKDIVDKYKLLDDSKRITLLNYIIDYIKQDQNKTPIRKDFLKFLIFHFRRKSDCILKTVTSYVDAIDPKEIIVLLEIISIVSNEEIYAGIVHTDGSLFLNVGCLLQSIQSIGQKSNNIFTPVQRIECLSTTSESSEKEDIEKSISYSLKRLLVQTIANLSHKNKKNQDLAREMETMVAVLNCLNLDARNPLIKEWATLAVRNLCEDNVENQKLVASLTQKEDKGDGAKYEVHEDFFLKTGSFSNKNL